jgi:ornithine cyclodeaminase/alanine dehydrogenase-like protein (mu-crystallin family)
VIVYVVTERSAQELVSIRDVIPIIESTFLSYDAGRSLLFPLAAGTGCRNSGRFGVKLGVDGERGVPGLKVGSYWPGNRERGLGNHASTTILLDNETGLPAAVIGATYLTALRTAAADAIAVKYLARPNAAIVAVIGAGHQALFDILAIASIRDLIEVRVASRTEASRTALCKRLSAAGIRATGMETRHALDGADVIVTASAATAPILEEPWVNPGTHISAMGADRVGKQELPIDLVANARLFADAIEQSCTVGELQHAVAARRVGPDDITPIGAVISARLPGRRSSAEITIFDSSGIALQDLAVCGFVLERALSAGNAMRVDL